MAGKTFPDGGGVDASSWILASSLLSSFREYVLVVAVVVVVVVVVVDEDQSDLSSFPSIFKGPIPPVVLLWSQLRIQYAAALKTDCDFHRDRFPGCVIRPGV